MELAQRASVLIDADSRLAGVELGGELSAMLTVHQYSRPYRASLRELVTNACDAHVAAGRPDVSFDIYLDYDSELELLTTRVRDYGDGVSRDFLLNEFFKLGRSTKRGNRRVAGAFGIGAKAAFSVSSFIDVRSYTGTEVHHAVAHLDSRQGIMVSDLGTEPSDEPAGLAVQFTSSQPNGIWDDEEDKPADVQVPDDGQLTDYPERAFSGDLSYVLLAVGHPGSHYRARPWVHFGEHRVQWPDLYRFGYWQEGSGYYVQPCYVGRCGVLGQSLRGLSSSFLVAWHNAFFEVRSELAALISPAMQRGGSREEQQSRRAGMPDEDKQLVRYLPGHSHGIQLLSFGDDVTLSVTPDRSELAVVSDNARLLRSRLFELLTDYREGFDLETRRLADRWKSVRNVASPARDAAVIEIHQLLQQWWSEFSEHCYVLAVQVLGDDDLANRMSFSEYSSLSGGLAWELLGNADYYLIDPPTQRRQPATVGRWPEWRHFLMTAVSESSRGKFRKGLAAARGRFGQSHISIDVYKTDQGAARRLKDLSEDVLRRGLPIIVLDPADYIVAVRPAKRTTVPDKYFCVDHRFYASKDEREVGRLIPVAEEKLADIEARDPAKPASQWGELPVGEPALCWLPMRGQGIAIEAFKGYRVADALKTLRHYNIRLMLVRGSEENLGPLAELGYRPLDKWLREHYDHYGYLAHCNLWAEEMVDVRIRARLLVKRFRSLLVKYAPEGQQTPEGWWDRWGDGRRWGEISIQRLFQVQPRLFHPRLEREDTTSIVGFNRFIKAEGGVECEALLLGDYWRRYLARGQRISRGGKFRSFAAGRHSIGGHFDAISERVDSLEALGEAGRWGSRSGHTLQRYIAVALMA